MSQYLLSIVVLAMANAGSPSAPSAPSVGASSPTKRIVGKIATQPKGPSVEDLVKAVRAIEDRGRHMTPRYRRKIAEAALHAWRKTGVNPHLMLAIGRMESDFRALTLINVGCRPGRTCHADCGITQHHVRGSHKYVTRYCKWLRYNHKLSFLKSAQEIASHQGYCKARQGKRYFRPYMRCVLNRYNQGPFFKRQEVCLKRWTGRLKWKCVSRAIYWKKVLCFRYGAVNGLSPRQFVRIRRKTREIDRCRYFRWYWTVKDIAKRAYPAAKRVSPKPTSIPTPSASLAPHGR